MCSIPSAKETILQESQLPLLAFPLVLAATPLICGLQGSLILLGLQVLAGLPVMLLFYLVVPGL